MTIPADLQALFLNENEIPAEFQIKAPVCQSEFLINGELREWDGPAQEVFSPVYLQTASGLAPKYLGSYPLLSTEIVLEALNAAVKAYNNGKGTWPTMPVAERIHSMQEFAYRMKAEKAEVVKLLMWEIGKSYQDSAKEFDRTVDYICAT
ncbi:MAG TPA: NADP-dependent glyceraldehyde-3-phosphate dehydrogenase, partial [Firmicutes bacterium]|nr:NADP-dependent glyceraldehyde-3-phosphate dehydrogenase [Bacillota bacterium]